MKALDKKAQRLRSLVRSMGSAAVAFSGGVDSALVARIAKEELGPRAVAVTINSPLYPSSELRAAKALAKRIGIDHVVIESNQLEDKRFVANTRNRCYFCKLQDFALIRRLADSRGIAEVVDGTNADDKNDYRPGMRAKRELGVRSPLAEAGLKKREIRLISEHMSMPTASKSASACLASRIPYGDEITADKLSMIEKAEEFLARKGYKGVRVRAHGPVARIEVSAEDIPKLCSASSRTQLVKRFKGLGFSYVALDLQGYRTGSMNEVLQP